MTGNGVRNDLTTKMEEVNTWWEYNATHPCYKIYLNELPRRRLDECYVNNPQFSLQNSLVTLLHSQTEHEQEEAMSYCGGGGRIKATLLLPLLLFFMRLLRFN